MSRRPNPNLAACGPGAKHERTSRERSRSGRVSETGRTLRSITSAASTSCWPGWCTASRSARKLTTPACSPTVEPNGSKPSPDTRRPEDGLCLAKGQASGLARPARPRLRRHRHVAVHPAPASRQLRLAARGGGLARAHARAVRLARRGAAMAAPGCIAAALHRGGLRRTPFAGAFCAPVPSLAVRASACKPMPFDGLGACTSKAPSHPQPSPASGRGRKATHRKNSHPLCAQPAVRPRG